MKNTTLLTVGLLALSFSLSAQKMALGIRAGYTLSSLVSTDYDDPTSMQHYDIDDQWKSLNGWHAGLEVRLALTSRLGILAGLQYANKGYEYGLIYWPSGPSRTDVHLHYLDLPVLADYRIWRGLALQAGVEPGLLLKSQTKSGGETFDPNKAFGLAGGPYEDLNLNLLAGVEWQFGCGVFVGGRGSWGVLPVSSFELTNDNGDALKKINSYNRAWQFSLGYRYTFTKK